MPPQALPVQEKTRDSPYSHIKQEPAPRKEWQYTPDSGTVKAQLAFRKKCLQALTKEEYRFLKTKSPLMHYYLGLRTMALYAVNVINIYHFRNNPLIWFPFVVWQGCLLVNTIFLMHESCHLLIFNDRNSSLNLFLEHWTMRFYGYWCHVSAVFFKEYHGQHHHRFFRGEDDPKSTHFVPHDGNWFKKIGYFGPGLIRVFRSLNNSVKTVSKATKETCIRDRKFNQLVLLSIMAYCTYNFGFANYLKLHFLPHVVFFPIFFMVNRCGQHYCCDPNHAIYQSTPMKGSFFAECMFLYSGYHVEHHTFPEVPAYNLKLMNRLLGPRVYKKEGICYWTYPRLVWGWLVQNRKPYTIWWDLAQTY